MVPMPKTHLEIKAAGAGDKTFRMCSAIAARVPAREDGYAHRGRALAKELNDEFTAEADRTFRQVARERGMPYEYVKQQFAQMPGFRYSLAEMNSLGPALVNVIQQGRKVVFVMPHLASRLAETELNVPCEAFRLPFPAFEMVFKDAGTVSALASAGNVPAHAAGDYVSAYVHLESREVGPTLCIAAMGISMDGQVPISIMRHLAMTAGTTLEQALRTEWPVSDPEGQQIVRSLMSGNTNVAEEDDKRFFGPGLAFVRTVVNAVLYMDSADPDISGPLHAGDRVPLVGVSSGARRRKETELRKHSASEYIEVGGSFADPELDGDPNAEAGTSASPESRFRVRGHYKSQAFGSGRTERKTIWILPYWKGPDMAEIVSKPYVLGR